MVWLNVYNKKRDGLMMKNTKILSICTCLALLVCSKTDAKKLHFNPFKNPHIDYTVEDTSGAANNNKINVLNINVEMLRAGIPGIYVHEETFIEERAKHFPEAIPGYDAIVMEEAFTPGARRIMLAGLKNLGYRYATHILGAGGEVSKFNITNSQPSSDVYKKIFPLPVIELNDACMKDQDCSQAGSGSTLWAAKGIIPGTEKFPLPLPTAVDGGVMIVSKYPIEEAKQIFHAQCSDWDCAAKKGVVYAKINKDGQIYHLFGLHSDTGDDVQPFQYKRLGAMIEEIVGKNTQVPVLISGDFNFSGNSDPRTGYFSGVWPELKIYPKLANALDSDQGRYTTDSGQRLIGNSAYSTGQTGCTVDGVLYSTKHLKPKKSYNQPRPLYSKLPWGVRTGTPGNYKYYVYNDETKKWVADNQYTLLIDGKNRTIRNVYGAVPVSDLSDHFAAYGYFEF